MPSLLRLQNAAGLAPELAAGVAALYTQLVQQGKGTRSGFLTALLRRFNAAASLAGRGAVSDLPCVFVGCLRVLPGEPNMCRSFL